MRVSMLLRYLGVAFSYSAKWLKHTTQIETPSLRYVRKSRTRATDSTHGPGALKGRKSMGRILDPDWEQFNYVPAAKTDLRVSMERYKEMVRGENQGVHPLSQKSDNGAGNNGQVPGKPDHSLQSTKLAVIRGKG
jgi:hypothetical protein